MAILLKILLYFKRLINTIIGTKDIFNIYATAQGNISDLETRD